MNQFIKVNSLVWLVVASIIFSGCSDSSEKKEQNANAKVATASSIEVVANDNANEVKVKEKKQGNEKNKSYYLDYGVKSAYDQNAQPANKDASVRIKPRTTIDANMHIRSPYENVQISLLTSDLSKEFIVKCSACHSDYANGVIGPSLLGKDVEYIYSKINKFKEDRTLNVLMSGLVENMSQKEMRDMAKEIYRFNLEIQKMRNK